MVSSLRCPEGRPLRAAVVGASGGIGSQLVSVLAENSEVGKVFAFSRSAHHEAPGVSMGAIDVLDETSIAAAATAASADGPLDLVLVATGLLHDKELRPEKSMRELEAEKMARVFAVNTIAPAMVAKHFLPLLRKRGKTVFGALSARVGSIGDNRLGGWTSYRASKAALNMTLKTLAIEHARRFPQSVVAALHPGTVDTGLSAPFQKRVPQSQLFTGRYAAEQLLSVVDALQASDSGGFFAWDGSRIDY
ncbi:MAG: SDR family NAD(P)-dependent oxidoreductase [Gammaproteobacteria bacterium]